MSDYKDWPLAPNTFDWWLESNTKTFRSDFNGSSQVARFPGSRWKCSLSYNSLDDERACVLEALVTSLDGEFGRVRMISYGRKGQKAAGVPVVAVADQTGLNLITSGWTPNTDVLKVGQFITVNDELKQITGDVKSDATGYATIPFSPQLRSSPPVGAAIETERPTGIFKLADNKQGKFKRQRKRGVRSAVTLEFEEAF
jgi:hypothetical protein